MPACHPTGLCFSISKTTRPSIPQDRYLHTRRRDNLSISTHFHVPWAGYCPLKTGVLLHFSAWEASSADNGFTVHGLLVDVGAASWSTRQLHHLSRGCSSLPANASSTRQMTTALQRSCWLGNRHWPGTPLGEGTNP